MKTLFVFHTERVSGAEVVIKRALNRLFLHGVEPYICTSQGEVAEFFNGVSVKNLELEKVYPPTISAISKTKKFVQKNEIELLWANSPKAAPLVAVVKRLTHCPAIWAVHDIMKLTTKNKLFVKTLSRQFEKIIAVSDATKKRLIELGANDKKVVVAKPGIDLKSWRAQASEKSSLELTRPAVVMVGAITRWKGQHIFLDAASKILEKGFNANFYIVGDILDERDSAYKREILERLSNPPLVGFAHYLGKRSDVANIISSADVVVHASCEPDPFPTVVVESLALGKAVVASKIGGVPEQIIDGETGFLFEPNDPNDLAVKISKLITNPELLEDIGRRAYDSAEKFDISEFAKKILHVINLSTKRERDAKEVLEAEV